MSNPLGGKPHLGITTPASLQLSSAQQGELQDRAAAAVWARRSFSGAAANFPFQKRFEEGRDIDQNIQEAMLGSFMMQVRSFPFAAVLFHAVLLLPLPPRRLPTP